MTDSTIKATLKTSIVNGETFTLTPTYQEMDDQVLMHLADQMLREMGGSRGVTSEIEFILKHADEDYDNAPFCFDDITNNEPTCEIEKEDGSEETMTEGEKQTFIEDLEEKIEDLEEELPEGCDSSDIIEDLQKLLEEAQEKYCDDYPEIMQWFALDERLIYRLEEMGECTLSGEYWGRCAYGQSITTDGCIKRVCYDLAMCWAK